ncbi:histidinol-phosphate transaminase [Cryobacterium sp. LW097]|uniref:histidinol-phosphate transaminase n=1 Tax=unclassified Cryobacterium TaxID=2649013 RepID=UPI000B4DD8E0|nr:MULTISPECIES: histidinol-phosphate transaminase [unclassified Cryobacterium]ASD21660.1 histidinol-phosphate transaminase [Cryobacterium sp. LW097]TFC54918.1 histidinol-phosphate transaminase [Cryobacterium sp. TMB3-1-2]TFC62520.1 histidinol-phosphate transaminase [Cryobacterium sp. TMB1-7]TFC70401.1 histidinol-phosphate transaminase [Cryobacterium sp. TMB3-15]TFC75742.1 histidinol-phosphate transaminase [Cryobacterium sp. TMB3-10]
MTSLDDLPLRANLRGQTPYGAPQLHVPVALNVNENTHPIPPAVAADIAEALAEAILTVNRYPDREFSPLRDALAGYLGHGLTRDNIWAANGSNEVLQQVLQAFGGPGRSLLGYAPTYSMYSILASGTDTRWIPGGRDADYELSPETAARWVEETSPDIVFLCSPNNPTGTPLSLETIAAVYDATPGIVVVDEAYAEFAPDGTDSALTLLPGRERLLVSRTMSKAFAFAGVRLGYLAADPAVTDALRLVRLPYHLSALTQAAAVAALAHTGEMLAMVDDIRVQRDRLVTELTNLGFSPLRSGSNFVLFGGVSDPHAIFQALLAEGILIRDVGIPGHLRVSAGTEAETSAFLAAIARLRPIAE